MGTGVVLGLDGREYCLGCDGYCVGFLTDRDDWCCVDLLRGGEDGEILFAFLLTYIHTLRRPCDLLVLTAIIFIPRPPLFFYFFRRPERRSRYTYKYMCVECLLYSNSRSRKNLKDQVHMYIHR